MSEWDFYDAREGARSIYVTPIMPCGRALLPLPARGVGAEPWVDGRARIGREILHASPSAGVSVGKGFNLDAEPEATLTGPPAHCEPPVPLRYESSVETLSLNMTRR